MDSFQIQKLLNNPQDYDRNLQEIISDIKITQQIHQFKELLQITQDLLQIDQNKWDPFKLIIATKAIFDISEELNTEKINEQIISIILPYYQGIVMQNQNNQNKQQIAYELCGAQKSEEEQQLSYTFYSLIQEIIIYWGNQKEKENLKQFKETLTQIQLTQNNFYQEQYYYISNNLDSLLDIQNNQYSNQQYYLKQQQNFSIQNQNLQQLNGNQENNQQQQNQNFQEQQLQTVQSGRLNTNDSAVKSQRNPSNSIYQSSKQPYNFQSQIKPNSKQVSIQDLFNNNSYYVTKNKMNSSQAQIYSSNFSTQNQNQKIGNQSNRVSIKQSTETKDEIKKLRFQLEQQNKQIQDLKQTNNEKADKILKEQNEELQKQLQQKDLQLTQMEKDLKNFHLEIQSQQQLIDQQRKELENSKNQLKQSQQEIEALKSQKENNYLIEKNHWGELESKDKELFPDFNQNQIQNQNHQNNRDFEELEDQFHEADLITSNNHHNQVYNQQINKNQLKAQEMQPIKETNTPLKTDANQETDNHSHNEQLNIQQNQEIINNLQQKQDNQQISKELNLNQNQKLKQNQVKQTLPPPIHQNQREHSAQRKKIFSNDNIQKPNKFIGNRLSTLKQNQNIISPHRNSSQKKAFNQDYSNNDPNKITYNNFKNNISPKLTSPNEKQQQFQEQQQKQHENENQIIRNTSSKFKLDNPENYSQEQKIMYPDAKIYNTDLNNNNNNNSNLYRKNQEFQNPSSINNLRLSSQNNNNNQQSLPNFTGMSPLPQETEQQHVNFFQQKMNFEQKVAQNNSNQNPQSLPPNMRKSHHDQTNSLLTSATQKQNQENQVQDLKKQNSPKNFDHSLSPISSQKRPNPQKTENNQQIFQNFNTKAIFASVENMNPDFDQQNKLNQINRFKAACLKDKYPLYDEKGFQIGFIGAQDFTEEAFKIKFTLYLTNKKQNIVQNVQIKLQEKQTSQIVQIDQESVEQLKPNTQKKVFIYVQNKSMAFKPVILQVQVENESPFEIALPITINKYFIYDSLEISHNTWLQQFNQCQLSNQIDIQERNPRFANSINELSKYIESLISIPLQQNLNANQNQNQNQIQNFNVSQELINNNSSNYNSNEKCYGTKFSLNFDNTETYIFWMKIILSNSDESIQMQIKYQQQPQIEYFAEIIEQTLYYLFSK